MVVFLSIERIVRAGSGRVGVHDFVAHQYELSQDVPGEGCTA
jgi:hypothetical protein